MQKSGQSSNKFKLELNTFTWVEDNFGLYDYKLDDYSQLQRKTLDISDLGYLYRNEQTNTIFYNSKQNQIQSRNQFEDKTQFKPLLSIESISKLKQIKNSFLEIQIFILKIQKDNKLYINPAESTMLWRRITSDSKKNLNKLKENQTFKLGRKEFKIIEIQSTNKPKKQSKESHYNLSNIACSINSNVTQQVQSIIDKNQKQTLEQCRICLSGSCNLQNPLIAPCLCKGTQKWIHFDCVKQWIQCRIQVKKKEGYYILNKKSTKCELCKQVFMHKFNIQDQSFHLYDFNKYELTEYIVLEDSEDVIYIIDTSKQKQIKIGRGGDQNIRINEITVSRSHLILTVVDDQFITLQDCGSKFGSLTLVEQGIPIEEGDDIEVQSGRSYIKIHFKGSIKKIKGFFEKIFCLRNEQNQEGDQTANQIEEQREIIQMLNEDSIQLEQNIIVNQNGLLFEQNNVQLQQNAV